MIYAGPNKTHMCLFICQRLTPRAAPAAGPLGARPAEHVANAPLPRAQLSLARARAFPPERRGQMERKQWRRHARSLRLAKWGDQRMGEKNNAKLANRPAVGRSNVISGRNSSTDTSDCRELAVVVALEEAEYCAFFSFISLLFFTHTRPNLSPNV